MTTQNSIRTWIRPGNLRPFLERAFALIGDQLEDWDWDAIHVGVRDTDVEQDHWFEYETSDTPPVKLAFAHADHAQRLYVSIEIEERTAVKIEALAQIMQCFEINGDAQELEALVQAAFIDTPSPDPNNIVGCDAAHLAVCDECQEALAFFQGKHWMDLVRSEEPLPRGYAGLNFLSPEARRFFFAAYLLKAIQDKDADLIETALVRVRRQPWSPLQQELIEFARLIKWIRVT